MPSRAVRIALLLALALTATGALLSGASSAAPASAGTAYSLQLSGTIDPGGGDPWLG